MRKQILKWIKRYGITVWLLVAILALAVTVSYAAYVNREINKFVLATGKGNQAFFSSNCLYLVDAKETQYRNRRISPTQAQQLKMRRRQRWSADFGMIASLGGVIIVPILLGVFGGGWLDEHFPLDFSWRLSLLFLGLLWGLVNGYYWLKFENAKIEHSEQRANQELQKDEKNEL